MTTRLSRGRRWSVALAATALTLPACGGDQTDPEPTAARHTPYVDDRGPGAVTAAATPGPGGQYPDPVSAGNIAQSAEETVRDYQESLASGAAGDACRELAVELRARLAGGGCVRAAARRIAERGRDGYRPSKILAVRVPSLERARVTVQDGDGEPFTIVLAGKPNGGWSLTDVDLGAPSGLRPAGR